MAGQIASVGLESERQASQPQRQSRPVGDRVSMTCVTVDLLTEPEECPHFPMFTPSHTLLLKHKDLALWLPLRDMSPVFNPQHWAHNLEGDFLKQVAFELQSPSKASCDPTATAPSLWVTGSQVTPRPYFTR